MGLITLCIFIVSLIVNLLFFYNENTIYLNTSIVLNAIGVVLLFAFIFLKFKKNRNPKI